jgi:hypothetical protein
MTSSFRAVRAILTYGICLPLAVILGYALAEPDTLFSPIRTLSVPAIFVVSVLLLLIVPVLLKWHHPLLILTWNATAVAFFIQGRPGFWLVMTALSLLISLTQKALDRRVKFIRVPSVGWALVFLLVVTWLTARLTGGIGLRAFGGETWGGRRYVYVFGAILGYFAFTSTRIPLERAPLYVGLFLLGGLTWAVASMQNVIGPSFYFLFLLFPVELLPGQVTGAFSPRMAGIPLAAIAALSFMLARYGIRGVFGARKPWRALIFLSLFVIMLLGGFRSYFITVLLFVGVQFWLEGLHRTRLLMAVVLGVVVVGLAFIPLLPRLPFSVQRNFAWLPVEINPAVRYDAQESTNWRVKMWEEALPEIPSHLLLGKGFAINPNELLLSFSGWRRGGEETLGAYVAGDYHNGPLSLIIPFGIWGVIGFLWFMGAGLHVLYRNYQFGDPSLRTINTFLLASFIGYAVVFLFVAGAYYADLPKFCGLLGFSVSLNGGVSKPVPVPVAERAQPRFLATILPRPKPAFGR